MAPVRAILGRYSPGEPSISNAPCNQTGHYADGQNRLHNSHFWGDILPKSKTLPNSIRRSNKTLRQ
jgi:hypothetical protein